MTDGCATKAETVRLGMRAKAKAEVLNNIVMTFDFYRWNNERSACFNLWGRKECLYSMLCFVFSSTEVADKQKKIGVVSSILYIIYCTVSSVLFASFLVASLASLRFEIAGSLDLPEGPKRARDFRKITQSRRMDDVGLKGT